MVRRLYRQGKARWKYTPSFKRCKALYNSLLIRGSSQNFFHERGAVVDEAGVELDEFGAGIGFGFGVFGGHDTPDPDVGTLSPKKAKALK